MEYYKNLNLENIVYLNDLGMECLEEWISVKDYEGHYEISTLGRIKSLDRWRKNFSGKQHIPERILVQNFNTDGYLKVKLSKNGIKPNLKVHQQMAINFLNHTLNGGYAMLVDHKNNIKTDNTLFNLQILNNRQNVSKDMVNKSGTLGIYPSNKGKKFTATIYFNGKSYNLGSYCLIEQASKIRQYVVDCIEKGLCFDSVVSKRGVIKDMAKVNEILFGY
ncbi:MAG: hypothetical protein KBC56_07285 [Flavobacterium sp.]|nr:hypothetical protein [Flavobacterium sp.]